MVIFQVNVCQSVPDCQTMLCFDASRWCCKWQVKTRNSKKYIAPLVNKLQSNHQHQRTNTVFSSWISFLSLSQLNRHCQSTEWWSLCTPLCAKIVLGEKVSNRCWCVRSNHMASVVVKNFFRSRDQGRDLGHQVSRPRPRPGQNELECTQVSRPWSRDHNTAYSW